MTPHADACDWNLDQYPFECTCGAVLLDKVMETISLTETHDGMGCIEGQLYLSEIEEIARRVIDAIREEQKKNAFLQPLPKGIPVGPPQETTT